MKRRIKTVMRFEDTSMGVTTYPWVQTKIGPPGQPYQVRCQEIVSAKNIGYFARLVFKSGEKYVSTFTDLRQNLSQFTSGIAKNLYGFVFSFEGAIFRIDFTLFAGSDACENCITGLSNSLIMLGAEETAVRRYLEELSVTQTTEVKWEGQWMTYAKYLQLTLPAITGK